MKEYTKDELKQIYKSRKECLLDFMKENNITAVVFEDKEERRTPAVRYFTGHPGDAVFIMADNGKCALIPWDENLAKERAVDIKIVPYNKYGRVNTKAVFEVLKSFKINDMRKKLEISPMTPYPEFLEFVDKMEGWDVLCRKGSAHDYVVSMRTIKDDYEIECTKEAARIGDLIIEEIEKGIKENSIQTETDVALLIEKELRIHGCERTGFDTLAAGPDRSWAIHAFPGYTDKPWPAKGLSILDFGVVYQGYTSDTTLTVVKDPSPEQEELVNLVEEAARQCLEFYKPDTPVKKAAEVADKIFAKAKRVMPHTLGHGIGLEIHEWPRVSAKQNEDVCFLPGNIITLEPGLYDSQLGGVRLENDVLITEEGNEVITRSKIIRV